ncbi:MAG: hypothetical protein ACK4K0_08350 [Flavobacteriales bacterium]
MKLYSNNILIISNEPWGEVWYSKHNYAYELSKGNQVIFINPASKWRLQNLFRTKVKVEQISESLYQLSYFNFLPAFFLGYNNRIVSKRIQTAMGKMKFTSPIFWSFDPYRLYEPKLLDAKLSIFHAVDKYLFIHPAEEKLYRNVNLFLSVSKEFEQDFKRFNKPILTLPHGISSEEFVIDEKGLAEENIMLSNYGLYVGNIDNRIDYELLEMAIKQLPSINFVFIGNINIVKKNPAFVRIFEDRKYSNVHYLGAKNFKKLKYHIHKSLFCIAFMSKNHPGNLISHHKIYQYLSLGKAVFSPVFSEYQAISHLLYMENDSEELIKKLELFLSGGENPTLSEERINYARGNTYENVFDEISKHISNL